MNNQNNEITPVQNVYPQLIPTELVPVVGMGESKLSPEVKDALAIHSTGLTIGTLDVIAIGKNCGYSRLRQ